jgi:AcrR family transcriptional regulator
MEMTGKEVSTLRKIAQDNDDDAVRRERILSAAFLAFMKDGYAATSTLEIATRARVSKRALYELVGTKKEILAACISERARRFRVPVDMTSLAGRDELVRVLTTVGTRLIREISDPAVIAVFRLAIAEAVAAPEVANALDSIGRDASRSAVREIMLQAQSAGLVSGNPAQMAERFAALLWGDLMIGLLLRVAERPTEEDATRRARAAAIDFLKMHIPA